MLSFLFNESQTMIESSPVNRTKKNMKRKRNVAVFFYLMLPFRPSTTFHLLCFAIKLMLRLNKLTQWFSICGGWTSKKKRKNNINVSVPVIHFWFEEKWSTILQNWKRKQHWIFDKRANNFENIVLTELIYRLWIKCLCIDISYVIVNLLAYHHIILKKRRYFAMANFATVTH